MKFNSLRSKIIFIVVLYLFIFLVSALTFINISNSRALKLQSTKALENAQASFQILMHNDIKMLSSTLDALMLDETYQKLFIQKKRDILYSRALPFYQQIRIKFNISLWYFIEPEPLKTCFLRMHSNQVRGDTIKKLMLNECIKTKNTSSGLELGKTAYSLRVVKPYYDKNHLIGYMELGEEIDHFIELMKKQTGNEYGLMIDKRYISEYDWKQVRMNKKLPNNWNDLRNMVLVNYTADDDKMIKINHDMLNINDEGIILDEIRKDDKIYIRGFIPIYDAGRQKVGGLIVMNNITELYSYLHFARHWVLYIGIIMIILAAIIASRVTNSLINKHS